MQRRVTVFGLVLAAAAALALGGSAAIAGNSQTFADSTGEDPAAPDITSVAVSNDDAGIVSFQINVANRPALTPDMLFLVFVDSIPGEGDRESFGADYLIQLEPAGVAVFKWNGSDYLFQSTPSLTYTYGSSGPTIKLHVSGLGNGRALNLVVLAYAGLTVDASGNLSAENAHSDLAPDRGRGTYAYSVKVTVTLKPAGFTTSPTPARAGRPFSVGLAVTQSDTGKFVQQADVTCAATVGGKRVTVMSRRLVNGVAACSWKLPPASRGKTIRGTITVAASGAQLKRSFSARIS
jgi:hypothetical protein